MDKDFKPINNIYLNQAFDGEVYEKNALGMSTDSKGICLC